MDIEKCISSLIKKAKVAQKEYEKFNQQQVDDVVREVAKVVYDNAKDLAKLAVDETRMGVFEDKIKKNQGKAKIIWSSLKGKKSVGIIDVNEKTGIVKVAKPMGVIGMVTPCTNPIVTPMCNIMFALKGRNSMIIAPHPRAKKCAKYLVDLFNVSIQKFNTPEDLIQVIEEPSVDLTKELMSKVDVIVATGGMGMVKAAYSSGKPAYGVGAGNVQCIIDREVDIKEVVPKIIYGRIFDNGIICSAEQSVIVPEENYDRIIEEFKANGAFFIDNSEDKEKLRKALFINGIVNRDVVGQSVSKVAEIAGIDVPEDSKVILVEADGIGDEDELCKEKMCLVLSTYKYKDFSQAVEIAQANLNAQGRGHSVSIHSNNRKNIEYVADTLEVSRFLINQICATMNGGSFYNGLAATTTLGCGSWGGNSISENLDYKHFINISRIAYYKKDAKEPTEDQLWG